MIRIRIKKCSPLKVRKRLKNKARARKKIVGTAERPRLVVFRSGKHIYAQLVDDMAGKILMASNTLKMDSGVGSGRKGAGLVGREIAQRALGKKIQKVVFDRNGFIYHGRVKALADSARETGLIF